MMSAIESATTTVQWVLWNSAGAAVVVVLVLAAQKLLGSRISARWRYNLWLLVLVRLVLPTLPVVRVELPLWARFGRTRPIHITRAGLESPRQQAQIQPVSSIVAHAPILEDAQVTYVEQLRPSENEILPGPTATQTVTAPDGPLATDAATTRPAVAPAAVSRSAAAGAARNPVPHPWSISWMSIVALAWFAGFVGLLVHLLWTSIRLQRTTRRLAQVENAKVHELLDDCCRLMRVQRKPRLLEAPTGSSPALIGVWRPSLLLPPCPPNDFNCRELRLIVLHELVHLKRGDVAINYLLSLLQAVHWFNPLIWLAFVRMRADRELACDEAVLRLMPSHERRTYGGTILKLLEFLGRESTQAGVVGVVQGKALMQRRIAMIAKFDASKQNRMAIGVLVTLMAAGAALVTTLRAQDAPKAPKPTAPERSVAAAQAAVDAAASSQGHAVADPNDDAAGVPAAQTPAWHLRPTHVASSEVPVATSSPQGPDYSIHNVEDPTSVQASAKTADKLQRPQSAKFDSVPLQDVLTNLAESGGVDIVIDQKALSDSGIDPGSSAVTLNIHDPRPLDQVLQLVLRIADSRLDYSLVNGVVLVSTRAELANHLITRAYEVGAGDREELGNLILNATGRSEGVRFTYFGDKLIITASEPRQRDIAKLLAMLGPAAPGSQRHQAGQGMNPASSTPPVTRIYSLKYANATATAPVLQSACSSSIRMAADPRTNCLVITAPEEDQKLAEQVLMRLDQPGREGAKTPADGPSNP